VAEQKEQRLQWRVPAELPQISADRSRLIQALNNLVSNALKFTPSGEQVRIEAREQGAEVVVEVSDTGPGISEEDQKKLFQRFFRSDAVRQQRVPGSGLGLSIVRAIIQQHDGGVYCRSQLGAGTTFGFTLPTEEA
jgi:signal transduction histidine kinase